MNNYEFCTQWIYNLDRTDLHILDYGCGAGQIVKALRTKGMDTFGCDIFYDGEDYSKLVKSDLFDQGIIRRMPDGCIPFELEYFDVVINNQVMEHVENINSVLKEIHRVLKPGGLMLNLFPHKGVWHEGHCGIPFLHMFPKNSHFRVYYGAIFRMIGFGYFKEEKNIVQWSKDFCDYLDQWTHYRSLKEIHLNYSTYFSDLTHIEQYWLQLRLGQKYFLAGLLPTSIQQFVVHKLAGMVFVAHKPEKITPEQTLISKVKQEL